MIEPRQEDIARNIRSLTALYTQLGQRIIPFIESVSESLAYQQAVVRDYREREAEGIRQTREPNENLHGFHTPRGDWPNAGDPLEEFVTHEMSLDGKLTVREVTDDQES